MNFDKKNIIVVIILFIIISITILFSHFMTKEGFVETLATPHQPIMEKGVMINNGPTYPTIYKFTENGTITFPSNIEAYFLVIGGGGGGGGGNNDGSSGPGGGGGGGIYFNNVTPLSFSANQTYNVTVGSSGAGGLLSNNGMDGGNSSINANGINVSVSGGKGGKYSFGRGGLNGGVGGVGGGNGVGGGTDATNFIGGSGGNGYGNLSTGDTGHTIFIKDVVNNNVMCSGGGGGDQNSSGGAGHLIGGDIEFLLNGNGEDAILYGCGGGGCTGDCRNYPELVGGAGAPGLVLIWLKN